MSLGAAVPISLARFICYIILSVYTLAILLHQVVQAFFLCPLFSKWQMFTFSRAHSNASTNATRHHKYSRGVSRLLAVSGVLGVIFWALFWREMALLALGGHPQPLKKALLKPKGTFFQDNECNQWYQNCGTNKICERNGGIFAIVCGICWGVYRKQKTMVPDQTLPAHARADYACSPLSLSNGTTAL